MTNNNAFSFRRIIEIFNNSFRESLLVRVIIHILINILIFALFVLVSVLFPFNSESIAVIGSWIIISYLTIIYFLVINELGAKSEKHLLTKTEDSKNQNLYQWLGEPSWDNKTIYSWLDSDDKMNTMENLREIKKSFLANIGESVGDYYLLRSYLEHHSKNNILSKIWKQIVVTISGVGVGGVSVLQIFNMLNGFVDENKRTENTMQIIEGIVQIGALTLIIFIALLYLYNEFNKDKRKVELIIHIIDNIIDEKEMEQANKID